MLSRKIELKTRYLILLIALACTSCATQQTPALSSDVGCKEDKGQTEKVFLELKRLRCYLYYSDYNNASKQSDLVQGLINPQPTKENDFFRKQLSYYKDILSKKGAGVSPDQIDGDYWRIVKGNPLYPRSAYENKIQGYAIVEFDINSTGNVVNPKAIRSVPIGVFNNSALKSLGYAKYLPRVIHGKAYEVKNVRYKLTYSVSD